MQNPKNARRTARMLDNASNSSLNSKHYCCLVRNSKVVASANNSSRSKHGKNFFPCCHAERAAIYRFLQSRRGTSESRIRRMTRRMTLYVVRVGSNGETRDSAPCMSCTSLIQSVGIRWIVYTTGDGSVVRVRASDYTTDHVSAGFKCMTKCVSKCVTTMSNAENYINMLRSRR